MGGMWVSGFMTVAGWITVGGRESEVIDDEDDEDEPSESEGGDDSVELLSIE
jgi:hypothetical protein